MHAQPPSDGNLFVDAVICGAIGGGVAYVFDRPLFLWAMLCAVLGPVFILGAGYFVKRFPMPLPGRSTGVYEFTAFAMCAAVAAAIDPFAA